MCLCAVPIMSTELASMLCITVSRCCNPVVLHHPLMHSGAEGLQNYKESLAEISFLLAASGIPTNQSTTGVEKCISVQTLLIASLFFEHAVKVKAVMHGPEFAK